ncbi:unnamed protein product [Danaus chrysippus]|uniref:(African queen) hypothetical protein n=1 Tax=Danaus chrysippus TaxID=151541 RepID=A0A8J2QP38_9NEOP|nr:unnamed protein product [Danaus chrysippus]
MIFIKLSFITFLLLTVGLFVSGMRPPENSVHHFVKRSLAKDGEYVRAAYENAFEGPHRLRGVPGFLH